MNGSVFQALGDETRRAILRMLRERPLTAGDIAAAFDLSKPTLSHHFRVLRSAGLVRAERQGNSIIYALQSNVIEDAATELFELLGKAPVPRTIRRNK
jgi:DNA-binding transcriptional ArsR family regulator